MLRSLHSPWLSNNSKKKYGNKSLTRAISCGFFEDDPPDSTGWCLNKLILKKTMSPFLTSWSCWVWGTIHFSGKSGGMGANGLQPLQKKCFFYIGKSWERKSQRLIVILFCGMLLELIVSILDVPPRWVNSVFLQQVFREALAECDVRAKGISPSLPRV